MLIDLQKTDLETWFKDKSNRKLIRKNLPKHFAKTLADKQRCSYNTVYQFMAGNYFNLELLVAMLELAKQHIESRNELQNKAIDLLNNLDYGNKGKEYSEGSGEGCLSQSA